jgi:hypothetical protein
MFNLFSRACAFALMVCFITSCAAPSPIPTATPLPPTAAATLIPLTETPPPTATTQPAPITAPTTTPEPTATPTKAPDKYKGLGSIDSNGNFSGTDGTTYVSDSLSRPDGVKVFTDPKTGNRVAIVENSYGTQIARIGAGNDISTTKDSNGVVKSIAEVVRPISTTQAPTKIPTQPVQPTEAPKPTGSETKPIVEIDGEVRPHNLPPGFKYLGNGLWSITSAPVDYCVGVKSRKVADAKYNPARPEFEVGKSYFTCVFDKNGPSGVLQWNIVP